MILCHKLPLTINRYLLCLFTCRWTILDRVVRAIYLTPHLTHLLFQNRRLQPAPATAVCFMHRRTEQLCSAQSLLLDARHHFVDQRCSFGQQADRQSPNRHSVYALKCAQISTPPQHVAMRWPRMRVFCRALLGCRYFCQYCLLSNWIAHNIIQS